MGRQIELIDGGRYYLDGNVYIVRYDPCNGVWDLYALDNAPDPDPPINYGIFRGDAWPADVRPNMPEGAIYAGRYGNLTPTGFTIADLVHEDDIVLDLDVWGELESIL